MKKLVVLLSIISLFGIAEAKKCTVNGPIPLFTSIEAMADAMTAWQSNKDIGKFLLGEMMAKGLIVTPKPYDEMDILHTLPNGVCQVFLNGRVYYTVEESLRCR